MKTFVSRLFAFAAATLLTVSSVSAGVIFSENMGTSTDNGGTAISVAAGTYVWERAGLQGPTVTFSGTGQTTTLDAASSFGPRDRSVRLNSGQNFQIGNVDTTGYLTYNMSFLAFRSAGIPSPFRLVLEFSTDGVDWTTLWNGGAMAAGWNSFTLSDIALDLSTTSRFRWRNTGTAVGSYFRIDDAVLIGVQAVPEPAAMTLATLGLGAVVSGGLVRRRRSN